MAKNSKTKVKSSPIAVSSPGGINFSKKSPECRTFLPTCPNHNNNNTCKVSNELFCLSDLKQVHRIPPETEPIEILVRNSYVKIASGGDESSEVEVKVVVGPPFTMPIVHVLVLLN
jgi:hypothetical protein